MPATFYIEHNLLGYLDGPVASFTFWTSFNHGIEGYDALLSSERWNLVDWTGGV
jgi:hypothetical protein